MRTWAPLAGATVLSVVFVGLLQSPLGHGSSVSLVSNAGQLVAAALASAGCAVAAGHTRGQRRRAWVWLSAGTGSWAAGQAVWTYYEEVLGQEVPFPSLADVGFLAFPVLAAVGLVTWAGTSDGRGITRGRDLMDGAIIAVSLLVLSLVAVMAPIVAASDGSGLSLALSLAYPAGDVVLATLVLTTLVRSGTGRMTLALLALGLGAFSVADSLFLYLTSTGTYSSADLVSSSGWVGGFLFVAAAGLSALREPTRLGPERERRSTVSSWLWLAMPYLPLLAAGVALFVDLAVRQSAGILDLVLATVLVVMVLARQFFAMAENQRLLIALAEAGDRLEHLATHDPLTGLPNRVLFARRLDQALATPSSSVSVLFCDLDNFKRVNDELGHDAGDVLLTVVAERLLGCVRATDTVARLGGDEFAVVLADCEEAEEVAARVVASMDQETTIAGRAVRTTISVGLARQQGVQPALVVPPVTEEELTPVVRGIRVRATDDVVVPVTGAREATAAHLIRLADTAMYAAKGAGKGRATVLEADPVLS